MNPPYDTGSPCLDCLFVYGTLLRNVQSVMTDFICEYSDLLGRAYAIGALYDVGHYPALRAGSHQVYGEIIRLKDIVRTLEILDRYEGPQYRRIQLPVFMPASLSSTEVQSLVVWTYEFIDNTATLALIPGGDYQLYLNGRQVAS